MTSSNCASLAFCVLALAGLFSGCCTVSGPIAGGACGGPSCAVASCGAGADAACPGLLHGELAAVFENAITGGCCSGCGEIYYDEQINEPPTCDPCAGAGEFTGNSCGPCRPLLQRLRELWCSPCGAACGSTCGTCQAGGGDMYASEAGGTGYCPHCRDGVAGNPVHHSHQHATPHHVGTPTPAHPKPNASTTNPVIQVPSSTPRIEPTPDPAADAPPTTAPAKTTQASPAKRTSRTIQVPAVQVKHTRPTK